VKADIFRLLEKLAARELRNAESAERDEVLREPADVAGRILQLPPHRRDRIAAEIQAILEGEQDPQ
jgi:hypothetical protein